MAAVVRSVEPLDEAPKRLLGAIAAAKSAVSDGFVPDVGMPGGGDNAARTGWFSGRLVAGWWPTESGSGVIGAGDRVEIAGAANTIALTAQRKV